MHCDSTVLSDRHHLHKCIQCAQQCCHADHAAWDSHQLLRDNPEHGAVWWWQPGGEESEDSKYTSIIFYGNLLLISWRAVKKDWLTRLNDWLAGWLTNWLIERQNDQESWLTRPFTDYGFSGKAFFIVAGVYVLSLNFKTICFAYWGESHVHVRSLPMYLH